jgi:hypothetical protein
VWDRLCRHGGFAHVELDQTLATLKSERLGRALVEECLLDQRTRERRAFGRAAVLLERIEQTWIGRNEHQ